MRFGCSARSSDISWEATEAARLNVAQCGKAVEVVQERSGVGGEWSGGVSCVCFFFLVF